MKSILQRLEGSPGVVGAQVMTLDGVVVASIPEQDKEKHEKVAAFASNVLLSIEKDAETLGFVPLKRLTLWAGRGRLILMPIGEFAMVVLADRNTDLSYTLMEVTGLARGLLRRSKIEVRS